MVAKFTDPVMVCTKCGKGFLVAPVGPDRTKLGGPLYDPDPIWFWLGAGKGGPICGGLIETRYVRRSDDNDV